MCWVRGQVRVTLGLFQRNLYWRCHLNPDPTEAGLSLRHGSSAWVTRPERALAGAFLTSFSSSPSHQGSQTRIPPLLFVDAGSGSKGFLPLLQRYVRLPFFQKQRVPLVLEDGGGLWSHGLCLGLVLCGCPSSHALLLLRGPSPMALAAPAGEELVGECRPPSGLERPGILN